MTVHDGGRKRMRVSISGDGAAAVREALLARLSAEVQHVMPIEVMMEVPDAEMGWKTSPHDSADFAVEKILDALAERGWIHLGNRVLSAAEEEALRDRLHDLGYIE